MNHTLILPNGEKIILGQTEVICKGLDMRCFPCIAKGVICMGLTGYILKTEGIRIAISDLSEYSINTPANRKALKATF